MANIMDYLEWRGDLSFDADPFNEVDNLICSQLSTPDFSGIVPERGALPLSEAIERYSVLYGREGDRLGALISPCVLPLLRRMAETRRFGDTLLCDYADRRDEERVEQFSALTARLGDGSCYISYRGTDDTIASWKEDFLMSVVDVVPAQADALEYLRRVAARRTEPLRLGGHSKGGNVALYAAIHAPAEIQRRIIAVYNNDGPGFRTSVVGTPGYERVRGRLHAFLPQNSVVGMLLERTERPNIVHSTRFGPEAHDGFTWEVLGNEFVRRPEFSAATKAFDDTMKHMEQTMDDDKRRAFVDALFEVLTSTNAVTLTDLTEHKMKQVLRMLREGRRSPELQEALSTLVEVLIREYAEEVIDSLPELPRKLLKKKTGEEAQE